MVQQKKLFLLDAYALIFRAYYAFINRPIKNSKGLNTSAIFGFTTALDEVLRKEKPTHIAVVFDPPSPTFRHKMYAEYKANRLKTPEEIKESIPYIKEIISAYNIQYVEVEGFEADDLIGTLAKKAEKEGYITYMMTPDKDYGQLVSENIFMYKPARAGNSAEIIGENEIKEKYEIDSPIQVIDILALSGDSSDNIPGAPGIGDKTAIKLIKEYKSVENLLKNSFQLKGKQKENIEQSVELLKLSKELVTIKIDVPTDQQLEQLVRKDINREKLINIFDTLEFRTLKSRILENFIESSESPKQAMQGDLFSGSVHDTKLSHNFQNIESIEHQYNLVENEESRSKLIIQLNNLDEFCFDTETTSLNVLEAQIVGLAFSFNNHEAYYVTFPEDQGITQNIINEFKEIFENEKIGKIGQNLKYDIQILANYGISVKGQLFDTMLAHYLIQPELRHNLNYLAESYLNYKMVPIESLIGKKGISQTSMRTVDINEQKEYAGEDADITWQLSKIFRKKLVENHLKELSENVEMPLIQVLADMERIGVKLNINDLNNYAVVLKNEIDIIQKEIFSLSGVEFNISSPKQLGEILFDRLKIIDNAKKTKTKQYSTGEDVLTKLKDKHEIVNKILDYRSLTKLLSTYVEALPKLIYSKTGKIHTSYNQSIAATGRLSSTNPNLQNIPIREERGREIRKSFVPSCSDCVLMSVDYSQIELRLMAHMSEDEKMIQAFVDNEDIHASTAAKIYNIPIDQVDSEKRRRAKTANFGIIYGISAFGLSQRLNIPRNESKELIDNYFNTYTNIRAYMNLTIEKAKKDGYVQTLMGRKRYLPEIHSGNAIVRGVAERNAINAPIQGSAADIIKLAMINIHNKIKDAFQSKMILQVHDELVFDVYNNELEDLRKLVKYEMENVISLRVPLIVDIGTGNNWLEAH
ncbi:MAG: DNA polymerase I [Bacteroidales bacterium]|nr:DNA polymerase I [Bacteroidales bacterium]